MLGGNINAIIQEKKGVKNDFGEFVSAYTDKYTLLGWLDMISASDSYKYKGKFEESTHVFICDYQEIDLVANECRLICNDAIYEVLYIDDPMNLHEHLEILLKYTGVMPNGSN